MSEGPFGVSRPLATEDGGPLGVERPLVQPERASIVEHHVTRDSAAKVVAEDKLPTIELELEGMLFNEVSNVGVPQGPDILAKARNVVIQTDVSDLTMDEVHRITERYESLGLKIKDINFR